jgi:hypothetical protein
MDLELEPLLGSRPGYVSALAELYFALADKILFLGRQHAVGIHQLFGLNDNPSPLDGELDRVALLEIQLVADGSGQNHLPALAQPPDSARRGRSSGLAGGWCLHTFRLAENQKKSNGPVAGIGQV